MAEPLSDTSRQALQLRLGMGAGQQNRYLFSDHCLEQLLVGDGRWGQRPSFRRRTFREQGGVVICKNAAGGSVSAIRR
jgi:hypothetical protein